MVVLVAGTFYLSMTARFAESNLHQVQPPSSAEVAGFGSLEHGKALCLLLCKAVLLLHLLRAVSAAS
jgi:hypothetical protein